MRDRLRDGGVLIVNAGHPEGEDELEKVLTATIGEVFPHVLRDPIEPTNTLIVASDARRSRATACARSAERLPAGLRPTAAAARRRLEPPLPGGDVYTDDKAPVEWLIDKSIVDYAAGGGTDALTGFPDVAIVGGGIVGCAAAAFLAEAGARVELFERDELAGAASGPQLGLDPAPVRPCADRAPRGDAGPLPRARRLRAAGRRPAC